MLYIYRVFRNGSGQFKFRGDEQKIFLVYTELDKIEGDKRELVISIGSDARVIFPRLLKHCIRKGTLLSRRVPLLRKIKRLTTLSSKHLKDVTDLKRLFMNGLRRTWHRSWSVAPVSDSIKQCALSPAGLQVIILNEWRVVNAAFCFYLC